MRSTGFTILLGLTASVLLFLAAWQWFEGGFEELFGPPPVAVGQRLYGSFEPDDVAGIKISGDGVRARFSRENGEWRALTPWLDRMDPRAAAAIISFTLGMRVEDLAKAEKIDLVSAKLEEDFVGIQLETTDGEVLASYRLGRVTPWQAEVEGIEEPVATVFVRPGDNRHGRHVYVCTGDINPLFKEGLRFLRDHRPFYFNPAGLEKIRIRSQQGDLTLGRGTPQSPWRIIKPLDLPTDPAAMKKLLEGLFELQALRVSDRTDNSPPATDTVDKSWQIAITSFGSAGETTLEILNPESADAALVRATVSDRPETFFELPLKPEPDILSLADLPLAMNDLRDPTLTRLNIASLREIGIQPSTGAGIVISRQPTQPWMVLLGGVSREANEENLFALLKAVTSGRATGFESDAATDFTLWGLDRPVLTLRFSGINAESLELRFGMDARGRVFANRMGTPTVMRMDESILKAISVRPHEWRHARLWSVDRVQLLAIRRTIGNEPPLVLKYQFNQESWEARQDDKDLTAMLDPARANHMLLALEGLKVARWLAVDDEAALAALKKPSLEITVTELVVDDDGEPTGVMDRTVEFAPAGLPGFHYGRLKGEPQLFLLDAATYDRLGGNLLEN